MRLVELERAGLPCGPINTVPDALAHPQAEARGLVLEAEHPTAGPVRFAGFPYKLSATPAEVWLPPPLLGQHTDEVLTGLLGYSATEIASLHREGVVGDS